MATRCLSLTSLLLLGIAQLASADNDALVGDYITDAGGVLKIVALGDQEIGMERGHQTIGANVHTAQDGYCYSFDTLDIIYPADLGKESTTSCLVGRAIVVSDDNEFRLHNGKKVTASKVKVRRYGEVAVNGRTIRRPGRSMTYFLYVSKQHGLVGFSYNPDKLDEIFRKNID